MKRTYSIAVDREVESQDVPSTKRRKSESIKHVSPISFDKEAIKPYSLGILKFLIDVNNTSIAIKSTTSNGGIEFESFIPRNKGGNCKIFMLQPPSSPLCIFSKDYINVHENDLFSSLAVCVNNNIISLSDVKIKLVNSERVEINTFVELTEYGINYTKPNETFSSNFWGLRFVMKRIAEVCRSASFNGAIRESTSVESFDLESFYEKLKPPQDNVLNFDYESYQPKDIHTVLRPYQKRCLKWMMEREKSSQVVSVAEKELVDPKDDKNPIEFDAVCYQVNGSDFGLSLSASSEIAFLSCKPQHEAFRDVLKEGDIITAVNGVDVSSFPHVGGVVDKILKMIRASPKGKLILRFLRWQSVVQNLRSSNAGRQQWRNCIMNGRIKIGNRAIECYSKLLVKNNLRINDQEEQTVCYEKKNYNELLFYPWDGQSCECNGSSPSSVETEGVEKLYWSPSTGNTIFGTELEPILDIKGGILGDEMGLGKTIEVISLIVSNKKTNQVITYPETLSSIDESELSNLNKLKCENGLYASRATIVVTPISIINQWVGEIRMHAPNLVVCVFDVSKKGENISLLQLTLCDVVLVTYSSLARELNFSLENGGYSLRHEKRYKTPLSPLMKVKWWRVVLDEAQFVESTVRQCSLMAGRLHAVNRWCVSGTPCGKGGLDDLYGLLLFLRHEPFSSFYLWSLGIKIPFSQHYMQKTKLNCNNFPWHGIKPLIKTMKPIFWRNSKSNVAHDLNLPSLTISIIKLKLSPVEDEYYKQLLQKLVANVKDLQSSNELQLSAISGDLVTLRKALCHPQVNKAANNFLGENDRVLSMEDIMAKMTEDSLDEVQMKQRDLCGALNKYGVALFKCNKSLDSKLQLEKSWQISQGVDVGRKLYKDELAVVRSWKTREIETVTALICVCEDLGEEEEAQKYKDLERVEIREYMLREINKKIEKAKSHMLYHHDKIFSENRELWTNDKNADKRVLELLEQRREVEDPSDGFYSHFFLSELRNVSHLIKLEETLVGRYYSNCSLLQHFSKLDELIQFRKHERNIKRYARVMKEMLDSTKTKNNDKNVEAPNSSFLDGILEKAFVSLQKELKTIKIPISQSPWMNFRVGDDDVPHPRLWPLEVFSERFTDLYNNQRIISLMTDESDQINEIKKLEYQKEEIIDNLDQAANLSELTKHNVVNVRQLDLLLEDVRKYEEEVNLKMQRHTYLKNKAILLKAVFSASIEDEDTEKEDIICSVCYETLDLKKNPLLTLCGHLYCANCIKKILDMPIQNRKCPDCRTIIHKKDLFQVDNDAISVGPSKDIKGQWGTKVEYLIKHLLKPSSKDIKCLVFSQWSPLLTLIKTALSANGIKSVELTGNVGERSRAIDLFNTDPNIKVFLLNSETDASGLTLVSASQVFLMEPNLSPAIEAQAINRVHRMGQKKDTFVYRLIIENSLETKIILLQEEKKDSYGSLSLRNSLKENLSVDDVLNILNCQNNDTTDIEEIY